MKRLGWIVIATVGCGSSAGVSDDRPAEGMSGGPCYPNSTCNAGLACVANACVESDASAVDTSVEDTGAAGETSADTAAATDTSSGDTSPPSPYVETVLTASCDTLGDGTTVAGASADDDSSGKIALPFAFKYFGAAVTQYSMASNGFAQLWDSSSGGTSKQPDNVAIPNSAAPNGMVAPFWDDLTPMFSETRAGVLGTAPNRRFVISWIHWTIKGETSTRLTFQAKLFETTNVIEFHYCAMAPDGNARATGSSATIGLENIAGTAGVQSAFNTAGSAPSGRALRFSP